MSVNMLAKATIDGRSMAVPNGERVWLDFTYGHDIVGGVLLIP